MRAPWQMSDAERVQVALDLANIDVASANYSGQPVTNEQLNIDNAVGVSERYNDGASQINHQMYNSASNAQVNLQASARGLDTATADNVKAN